MKFHIKLMLPTCSFLRKVIHVCYICFFYSATTSTTRNRHFDISLVPLPSLVNHFALGWNEFNEYSEGGYQTGCNTWLSHAPPPFVLNPGSTTLILEYACTDTKKTSDIVILSVNMKRTWRCNVYYSKAKAVHSRLACNGEKWLL
jgi:hypothetical protein